jgi:hypothetical protein
MPDKEIFEYAIIRYLPKVERGEFLNVGVIVMCKRQQYLKMKYQIDEQRLKAFSSEVDIDLITEYLNGWNLVCAGGEKGGQIGELEAHLRFRWLTASRSTIIQTSEVHPGLCFEPEKTLEDIFQKYVL